MYRYSIIYIPIWGNFTRCCEYVMPEPPEDYEFYDLWKKQQDPYSTYVGSKIIPCIVQ